MPAAQGWSVTMPVKRKSCFQQPRIFSCRSRDIEPESREGMNDDPSDDKDERNEEETEAESGEFPLVHERQVRQLCAIHAVNNLLQLDDSIADHEGNNGTLHHWICNGTKLPWTEEQILPATKKELDDIADGLTLVECKLLSLRDNDYEINISAQPSPELETLSMYQRLHSNHRTPVVGNYSFEVIETALQKRGVSLSWYKLDEEEFSDTSSKDLSLSGNSSLSNSGSDDEMVIGYILNKIDDAEDDTCWGQQYIQRLPWVGRYFESGRHWYAITRIRIEGTTTPTAEAAPSEVWRVLDSDSDTVLEYANDLELWKYLQSVQDNITGNTDTSIFRATLQLKGNE
eukprot:scaffold173826_cov62-Attheya_sp.AAC.5